MWRRNRAASRHGVAFAARSADGNAPGYRRINWAVELMNAQPFPRHSRQSGVVASVTTLCVVTLMCATATAIGRAAVTHRQKGPPLVIGRTYITFDAGLFLASAAVTGNPDCSPLPAPVHTCPVGPLVGQGPTPTFLSVWLSIAWPGAENMWQVLRLPLP